MHQLLVPYNIYSQKLLEVASFHPSPVILKNRKLCTIISWCSVLQSPQGATLTVNEKMILISVPTVANVPIYSFQAIETLVLLD